GLTSSVIQQSSGVSGRATAGAGIRGAATTGVGGSFVSQSGTGVYIQTSGTNIIEAFGASTSDIKFRVTAAGNVQADGTFTSPAADFAELMPATTGLEPGDVLVVGRGGILEASSKPYQQTVVIVLSKL